MRFFDNLFSYQLRNVIDNSKQNSDIKTNQSQPFSNNNNQFACNPFLRNETIERFDSIFGTEYKGFKVLRNVKAQNIGQLLYNEYEKPADFDYCFEKDGRIVAAVLILPEEGYEKRQYSIAKKICERANITCVNFYDFMENENSYIDNKMSEALK